MYFYTLGDTKNASDTDTITQMSALGDEDSQVMGAKILSLLSQINSLKIDRTLFNDPLYKILQDHTVIIPTENIGRTNPFEPYYTPVPPTSSAGSNSRNRSTR